MEHKKTIEITSFTLHMVAMVLMLCDHLWATVIPGNDWLTDIGRIAFPIFAFLIVEGYFHTRYLKKYVGRLFVFALISEIPFNLVMGSSLFYPVHQNVLWTFLIGIFLIFLNECAKKKEKLWLRIVTGIATVCLAFALGLITFVDYHYAGVLTVLVFYFFRGRKWWDFVGQLLCLYYLNVEVLSGFYYELDVFGQTVTIVRQSLPCWHCFRFGCTVESRDRIIRR